MFRDLERAMARYESAKRLSKLAGHYEGSPRSRMGTSDDTAFKKRVRKRRKKKGYK